MMCLDLPTEPYARGVGLGSAWRGTIAGIIALRPDPVPEVAAYAACVTQHFPGLALEVAGLAAGAEIDVADAWWLQLRRELADRRTGGECTTAAVAHAGLLGQTIDLPRSLGRGLHVARLSGAGEPHALVLTFAGLLGYLGLNSAGLAVAINMVRSGGWRVGVPPYLLIRAVLARRTLCEAVDLLVHTPRASSRCLTMLQGSSACRVELTPRSVTVCAGDVMAVTNHFLHPDLVAADMSNRVERIESRLRYRRITDRLTDRLAGARMTADGLAALLCDESFQVACRPAPELPGRPDDGAVSTVATVVMEPAAGLLTVRPRGEAWTTVTGEWVA